MPQFTDNGRPVMALDPDLEEKDSTRSNVEVTKEDYNTPIETRLKYRSDLHQKVLSKLTQRIQLSERHIKKRYDDWNRADEHIRLYIDLSRQARFGDRTSDPQMKEMPFRRSIVVPLSYAVLQIRLTQLLSIFFSRDPLLQIEGAGPEDVRPARIMEAALRWDMLQTKAALQLYSFIQDTEKYGLGIMYDVWEEEHGWIAKPNQAQVNQVTRTRGKAFGYNADQKEWGLTKEYNSWSCVDPYLYWPDPRVPVSDVQNGEFCGHRIFRGTAHFKERSRDNGGPYFNIEYIREVGLDTRTREPASRDKTVIDQFTLKAPTDAKDKGFYALDHIQVKLVPKDWDLGPETQPEIWWFSLIDRQLICRAHKSPYDHNQFTYSVGESNHDPHALFNQGTIENLDGLQRFINWLLNSHVENIRKFLNDAFVFSPALIEETDVSNPGPARHIRLTQKGEELLMRGSLTIPQMIQQLQIGDVTQTHLKTVQYLWQLGQVMTAATDPVAGQVSKERKTAKEIGQVVQNASNRVAQTARIIDAMAITPLALRAIANRQQFTSKERYIRIVGDLAKEMGGVNQTLLRQGDIQGSFDYIPHSGALPPDPSRMAEVWTKLLQAILTAPVLTQPGPDGKMLDVREVFNETVRTAGIKNISGFYVQVKPDAQVQQQVQQGNMIPMDQAA